MRTPGRLDALNWPVRLGQVAPILAGLVLIGLQLVGAFIGLDESSLWVDELYTAWTINTPDWPTAWSQMLMDVHPPVYSMLLRAWVSLVGFSDVNLRAFSALTAGLAIIVMILGTRRFLSLEARILTSVIAVTSSLWIEQSQNARMYGWALLIASILVVLTIGMADRAKRAAPSSTTGL